MEEAGRRQAAAGAVAFGIAWTLAAVLGPDSIPVHYGPLGIDRYGTRWGLLFPSLLVVPIATLVALVPIVTAAYLAAQQRILGQMLDARPVVPVEPDLYPAIGWSSAIVLFASAGFIAQITFWPAAGTWFIPLVVGVAVALCLGCAVVVAARVRRRVNDGGAV